MKPSLDFVFNDALERLTAHIKSANPYFQHGIANAWQDEETGGVYAYRTDGAKKPELLSVFPSDKLGDYFYLRNEKKATVGTAPQLEASDCGPAAGALISGTVHLVAVVKAAVGNALVSNLINTLGLYTGDALKMTTILWNREDVLMREMSEAEEKDIEAALQRLKTEAIVSVTFTLSVELSYKHLTCLPNPCSIC